MHEDGFSLLFRLLLSPRQRWEARREDPEPVDRWSESRRRSWQSARPERGRLAAEPRSVRSSPPRLGQCEEERSRRPCAAGGAPHPGPTGLDRRYTPVRSASRRPDALTCHPERGNPARLAAEGVPIPSGERLWPAVTTPRRARLRADGAVASHRAADGAVPSIEAARTRAHFISRGAAVGFPAFRAAIPRHIWRRSSRPRPLDILLCCTSDSTLMLSVVDHIAIIVGGSIK